MTRQGARDRVVETAASESRAGGRDAYSSFVVKWRRRLGTERIEVEHIQSGESTRVASAADALAWMRRQVS